MTMVNVLCLYRVYLTARHASRSWDHVCLATVTRRYKQKPHMNSPPGTVKSTSNRQEVDSRVGETKTTRNIAMYVVEENVHDGQRAILLPHHLHIYLYRHHRPREERRLPSKTGRRKPPPKQTSAGRAQLSASRDRMPPVWGVHRDRDDSPTIKENIWILDGE